jgi:6-phosphofructokinase 1
MKRRIGILTSGGDCPGLNAAIRGVAKAAYELFETEIIGFFDGYKGLIEGEYRAMEQHEFSGILTLGGTILGTSRQPYKLMRVVTDDVDKVAEMKKNYAKLKLDCLVTLGGNGTHKTAQLLSSEGLNVVGLPKTIDNDIWGRCRPHPHNSHIARARDGHRAYGQQGRLADALRGRGRRCGHHPSARDPL